MTKEEYVLACAIIGETMLRNCKKDEETLKKEQANNFKKIAKAIKERENGH